MKNAVKNTEIKNAVVDPQPTTIVEEAQIAVTEELQTPPKNIAELWERIDARLKSLEAKFSAPIQGTRSHGPDSTRSMTVDDAVRVMHGDLADRSTKDCAKELGLSYGQIYSARGGYTFKAEYAIKVARDKEEKAKLATRK